jgi:hypothetical protein
MKTQLQRTKSRFNKIISYRKTHTLQETGDKFNLTQERIRQIILTKNQKRCKIHNRLYYNKCSHCLLKSYQRLVDGMTYKEITNEAKKEAKNRKRDYLSVQRRAVIIKMLIYRWKRSVSEIARLLERDRSTITHSYDTN